MEREKIYLKKQLAYIKAMGKDIDKDDCFILFPLDWFINENYELKEEILDEAILKKCLIMDTDLYELTMQEGVVDLASILN